MTALAGVLREGRTQDPSELPVRGEIADRADTDLYKLVATMPAEQAFRPLSEGGCPLVHA